ncbi:hypothetical protein CAEBREN_30095 [Caenorhabditis brenneri]|uniref:Uncharacterized protein n=1 Tax=Caenorhabditis brenneri TaxID=135651 RepID=G0MFU6_CAEBE|nr:hypothetical protein CAEBREN_30095 [Caenorhabditis brenneri]
MSIVIPNPDLQQENARLLKKIQYYEQDLMGPAAIKLEDLADKLLQKENEISNLKTKLNGVSQELKTLKEDRSVEEEATRSAKMYSTLLEKMLDEERASYAPKCSGDSCPAVREFKAELENAQQEKKELEEMMEEFRCMWSKDTSDFQQTMTTVKEEGAKLQLEISRFQHLYQEAQDSISKFSDAILVEEQARREAEARSSELENQIEILSIKIEKQEDELQVLSEKNADIEDQLSEQEYQLKCQDEELAEALDKLLKSGEKAVQQAEKMKMDDLAHAVELSELTEQLETVKKESNEQIRKLRNEAAKLARDHSVHKNATAIQIQMIKSESNLHYEKYVKFESEALKLQKSLEESKQNSEKEAVKFTTTIHSLESELCATKSQMEATTRNFMNFAAAQQEAAKDSLRLKKDIETLKEDIKYFRKQNECTMAENEQLREKLNGTVRDYVAEREKLEQKQEEAIFKMQQVHSKHIEEVKHNNMLAINQEMIKAQMALDSTKKKYAVEYEAIKTKLVHSVSESDRLKKESETKIASLSRNVSTLESKNASLLAECAQLETSQSQANATLAKLNSQIDYLEEEAIMQKECHEKEIQDIKEAHRIILDNMGVEELDEEAHEDVEAIEEKNDSAQWELVDEE